MRPKPSYQIVRDNHPILAAEDHPDDALLLRMALKRAGVESSFVVVSTAEEAIEYFQGIGRFADRHQFPLPRLVFINLHLPQIGGIGLVKWIRERPAFCGVALIVITGSTHSPDVASAYDAGANAFMVKPNGIADLTNAVKATVDFWLRYCVLPPS